MVSAQRSTAILTVALDGGLSRESLLRLSTTAAETQAALEPDQALAQTIRQLKAAAAQLARAELNHEALARLQLAVEKAQVLAGTDTHPQASLSETARANAAGPREAAAIRALLEQAAQLATDLEQKQATPREEWLRRFPPDQIDPDYRRPSEDYFERLSREATTR